jgi:hypothetical protein
MNEKPKNLWIKSWTGWRGFLLWLILFFVIFFVVLSLPITNLLNGGLFSGLFALVAVLLIAFIRWLFCWRNFKRFLFGLACFATLIALFYAEEDWRGKHDWEKFKREWVVKGEHFDFASVIPESVPDDQNFALTPVVASSYSYILTRNGEKIPGEKRDTRLMNRLDFDLGDVDLKTNGIGNWAKGTTSDLKPWQTLYRELATKTNLFEIPAQPQSPATDVLLALGKFDPTVEELRQAGLLPESRFPLNYATENPATILIPHLAELKRTALLLQLRAIAELQTDQTEKSLDDVKLMLRLAGSVRTEPFLISHVVRIAILQIALQPVYEGLAERKWSDKQLVALDSALAKFDFLADYGVAIRGERGLDVAGIEYIRRSHNRFRTLTDLSGERDGFQMNMAAIALCAGPSGWFYQNELHFCQFYNKWYLPVADDKNQRVSLAAVHAAGNKIYPETNHRTPGKLLEAWLLPALNNMVEKFAYVQSSINLARVAIALERYRLTRGEFPVSLDALAPQLMEEIPHDVFNGLPLKYRRINDGQFVLYSIGWNGKDDGGNVAFRKNSENVDINQGDWVWRYPAR